MSHSIRSLSPQEKERGNRGSNTSKSKSAQLATGNDQYKSVISRIASDTPVALNTPHGISILNGLYPKQHTIKTIYEPENNNNIKQLHTEIDLESFINIITQILQEISFRPLGNIIIVIRYMVTYTEEHEKDNHIYAANSLKSYTRIPNNDPPQTMRHLHNAFFLFELHKCKK